jgi:hypothetical protein
VTEEELLKGAASQRRHDADQRARRTKNRR